MRSRVLPRRISNLQRFISKPPIKVLLGVIGFSIVITTCTIHQLGGERNRNADFKVICYPTERLPPVRRSIKETFLPLVYHKDSYVYLYSSYLDLRFTPAKLLVFGYATYSDIVTMLFSCVVCCHRNGSQLQTTAKISLPNHEINKTKYEIVFFECQLASVIMANFEFQDLRIFSRKSNLTSYPVQIQTMEYLKVNNDFTRTFKNKITVCVQPLWNNYGAKLSEILQFVQFMETASYFGADKVVVYLTSVSPSFHTFMQVYMEDGLLEVHNYSLPSCLRDYVSINGQTLALNDCFYRHMWSSEYIANMDFDEIFVPFQGHKWMDIINKTLQVNSVCRDFGEISIRSSLLRLDKCGTSNFTTSGLRLSDMLKSRLRCTVLEHHIFGKSSGPPYDRAKYITNPRNVIFASIHLVKNFTQPLQNHNCSFLQVHERGALVFHYRLKPIDFDDHPEDTGTNTRMMDLVDASILQFNSQRIDKLEDYLAQIKSDIIA